MSCKVETGRRDADTQPGIWWECCREVDVTIDLNTIPEESSLVDQGLKTQLAGIFGRMEKRVTIRAVVDLSGEKDREMASFLRAIVSVSPNLELELYGPDEADQVPELNTAWLPVTGLYKDGAYGRAAFHGVPGGREINSFVLAVYKPGRAGTGGGEGYQKENPTAGQEDKYQDLRVPCLPSLSFGSDSLPADCVPESEY